MKINRRKFIKTTSTGSIAMAISPGTGISFSNEVSVEVINPCNRVPVSLIIDDSTTLVNMAHYGIPQFAEVFPDRYKQNWRKLPREIPDSFVREFGIWCLEKGIKGKYSVVPYPACTGWVNQFIPGWTKKELQNSLDLIREIIVPNWDIHPEMISHTRVINIKTGRPYPDATPEFMENWEWSQNKSVDELASYQNYALQILKDAGLKCEGITTPGGYGSQNKDNLAMSTFEAVRNTFGSEIPHYFRDLYIEKNKSVAPLVRFPRDLQSNDPKCVVSVVGCTGDWFGGWDGLVPGSVDKFISEDLQNGRMVEVIDSGEPAVMVCHWPGIYYNGEKLGFKIFKTVVERLNQKYNNLIWMKLSEISRYWAAKELTNITAGDNKITLHAPFASDNFTLKINQKIKNANFKNQKPFKRLNTANRLKDQTFYTENQTSYLCFNLKKGITEIII